MIARMLRGDLVDPVTRLPNKKFLEELLKSSKGKFDVIEITVTLENLDESYRNIAISKVASVIKHSVRIPMDMVIRTGEYEFVVLMGSSNEGISKMVANRLKSNLSYLSMGLGGKTVRVKPVVRIPSDYDPF